MHLEQRLRGRADARSSRNRRHESRTTQTYRDPICPTIQSGARTRPQWKRKEIIWWRLADSIAI